MLPGERQYDVIILAGYATEPDALSLETGEPCKALLPLKGRPMVSYVLSALRASGRMRRLVLVGLSSEQLGETFTDIPVVHLPNRHDTVDNMLAGIEALGDADWVLFCSADIPLLTPEAIRDFLARCEATSADLYYPIVSREDMERRFPGSGRSFRQLVDGWFAGGDIYLVRPQLVQAHAAFARTLTARRKSAWGLARALGLEIILRFLIHRLRIADLERRANKILQCTCKAIISPYPELAMDVDKPKHLKIVLQALSANQLRGEHEDLEKPPC